MHIVHCSNREKNVNEKKKIILPSDKTHTHSEGITEAFQPIELETEFLFIYTFFFSPFGFS